MQRIFQEVERLQHCYGSRREGSITGYVCGRGVWAVAIP